jgi:formamidopyrimidine-DNA glycosylase
MPELAEVAWFARQWEPGLGAPVTAVQCRATARVFRDAGVRDLRRQLTGRPLTAISTHGKQMLFTFGDVFLGVHLGMTGELLVESASHRPGRHDHLVLRQSGRSLVFRDPRMFGRVRFEPGPAAPSWWTSLPPAVLSPSFTRQLTISAARRRRGSPLKAFLLDQEVFPGVGNWMADEILWRCLLDPATKVGTLHYNEIITIHLATRRLCRQALKLIGENWGDPPPSWLFPHRWKNGGRCPRDGTELRRAQIGGRTTAWCPQCQPSR